MKVDRNELEKQIREATLKSGKYALYEIVVPEMEGNKLPQPIIQLNLCRVGFVEIATILSTLKESYKLIAKQYPEAVPIVEKYFKPDNKCDIYNNRPTICKEYDCHKFENNLFTSEMMRNVQQNRYRVVDIRKEIFESEGKL